MLDQKLRLYLLYRGANPTWVSKWAGQSTCCLRCSWRWRCRPSGTDWSPLSVFLAWATLRPLERGTGFPQVSIPSTLFHCLLDRFALPAMRRIRRLARDRSQPHPWNRCWAIFASRFGPWLPVRRRRLSRGRPPLSTLSHLRCLLPYAPRVNQE